MSHKPSP